MFDWLRGVLAQDGLEGGSPMPHEVLFWGSFLLVPLAVLAAIRLFRGGLFGRLMALLALPVIGLGIYARFIEPSRLVVAEHDVKMCVGGLPGTLRAAVVSDMHYGVYRHAMPLSRIVEAVNGSGADLVLMPGDFTYHLDERRFADAFGAFADLRMPAYAVLGNHDSESPEAAYNERLKQHLGGLGITVLDPGEAVFRHQGKFLRIIGLRDLYDHVRTKAPLGDLPPAQSDMPTIMLEHNPDVIRIRNVKGYDLFVAGHTHGGQVWIPGLTCKITNACKTLRKGLAETPEGQLFVTTGTGMVGLPVRFNQPPRVDILDLTLMRCPGNRIRTPQPDWRAE